MIPITCHKRNSKNYNIFIKFQTMSKLQYYSCKSHTLSKIAPPCTLNHLFHLHNFYLFYRLSWKQRQMTLEWQCFHYTLSDELHLMLLDIPTNFHLMSNFSCDTVHQQNSHQKMRLDFIFILYLYLKLIINQINSNYI